MKPVICIGSNKPGEPRTPDTLGCSVCNFYWTKQGSYPVQLAPKHKQDLHGPSGGTLDGEP